MEAQVNKTLLKVIGFAACLMLTIFSGMFALLSLSALIVSAMDKDIISVLISAVCGVLAWIIWSIRKDVL